MSFTPLAGDWIAHSSGFTVQVVSTGRVVYSDLTCRAVFDVDVTAPVIRLSATADTVRADPGEQGDPLAWIVTRTALALAGLGFTAEPDEGLAYPPLAYQLLIDIETPTPHDLLRVTALAVADKQWVGRAWTAQRRGGDVEFEVRDAAPGTAMWLIPAEFVAESAGPAAQSVLSGLPGFLEATSARIQALGPEAQAADAASIAPSTFVVTAANGDRAVFLLADDAVTMIAGVDEDAVVVAVEPMLVMPFAVQCLQIQCDEDGTWSHRMEFTTADGRTSSPSEVSTVSDLLLWYYAQALPAPAVA